MHKEKFKTFLLLSLVFVSMFLTKGLWIRMPYEMLPFFQKEEVLSASYLLSDMIKPDRYLINFNEKNHTIFYSDVNNNLWANSRFVLAEILSSNTTKMEVIDNDEFLQCQYNKSIVFYFPEKFSTYLLAKSLDVTKPNSITEKIPNIDKLCLYLGKNESYVIFSIEEQHLKIIDPSINMKDIKKEFNTLEGKEYALYYPIRDTLNINSEVYITYRMPKDLPTVYVENELNIDDIDEIKNIAEVFFKRNTDYIREIIENNGSRLYVYKQKVLKINQNGLLEYFNPLEKPVKRRNLYNSLNTASYFLSSHLGIPKGLYLSKIEEIESETNLGYRMTFKYRIRGFPIIIGKDITEDFIQIDVFNEHIRNYKRFIRKDMNIDVLDEANKSEVLSAFDVVNMNYELLERSFLQDNGLLAEELETEELNKQVLYSINDISIAYLDPCIKASKEKLDEVWILRFGNRMYAFDMHNGNLVLSKND